jgi:hypothetical protein
LAQQRAIVSSVEPQKTMSGRVSTKFSGFYVSECTSERQSRVLTDIRWRLGRELVHVMQSYNSSDAGEYTGEKYNSRVYLFPVRHVQTPKNPYW